MTLLIKPWRRLWTLGLRDLLFTGCVLASLAVIEICGRKCQADWQDAFLGFGLAAVILATVLYHRRRKLASLDGLTKAGQFILSVGRRYAFVAGIDLRGQPPIPSRSPASIHIALGAVAIWAGLMAMSASYFPAEARSLAVRVWYVGYLTLLIALWAVLIFGIVLAAFLPAAFIHDYFVARHTRQGHRALWPELCWTCLYFGAIVICHFLLPLWVCFVLGFVPLVAFLLAGFMPQIREVQVLWMYHRKKTIWALPLWTWILYQAAGVTLLAAALELVACGSEVLGWDSGNDSMMITTWLGQKLALLAPGLTWSVFGRFVFSIMRDPARTCHPQLYVSGEPPGQDLVKVLQFFKSRGWIVSRETLKSGPTDVCVQLVPKPGEQSDIVSSRWPLRVTVAEAISSAVYWRLERRWQILQRRHLVNGLRKLIKIAATSKRIAGVGYWIAPHLWFVQGMCPDTRDKDLPLRDNAILADTIGPHYHRVLRPSARHHAYEILRAVQVDIILVEHGVGFRSFCRVLRMLFEIYDIHGGKQRAQEVHFTGIPGVRVILHDFQLTNPFKSETYPEPDYEDLGRARILHVFRDRGEEVEPLETPVDDTRVPVGGHAI